MGVPEERRKFGDAIRTDLLALVEHRIQAALANGEVGQVCVYRPVPPMPPPGFLARLAGFLGRCPPSFDLSPMLWAVETLDWIQAQFPSLTPRDVTEVAEDIIMRENPHGYGVMRIGSAVYIVLKAPTQSSSPSERKSPP